MTKPTVWDAPDPQPPSDNCPEPGIYYGVDFGEYCNWDAINHSRLQRIDKSPLHYATSVVFDSPSLRLGQLVHTGQLEPDLLANRYVVMPRYELHEANVTDSGKPSKSTATKYVKAAREQFAGDAKIDGLEIVTQAEFDAMQSCVEALAACPEAAECLATERVEVSIVWHDKHTGLRCKARIDAVKPDRLVDLKTKNDSQGAPMPQDFEWSLWGYNYYSQAAWYRGGWEQLTGERLPFWFAVVSTSDPIQAIAAPVGETSLRVGEAKNMERMAMVAACAKSGVWPGYESPAIFELPERYLPEDVTL